MTNYFLFIYLLRPHRTNYVFLQLGFQHLAYEKREDVPSYGLESLLGKSKTDINNGKQRRQHDLGPSTLMRFQIDTLSMVADGIFSNRKR